MAQFSVGRWRETNSSRPYSACSCNLQCAYMPGLCAGMCRHRGHAHTSYGHGCIRLHGTPPPPAPPRLRQSQHRSAQPLTTAAVHLLAKSHARALSASCSVCQCGAHFRPYSLYPLLLLSPSSPRPLIGCCSTTPHHIHLGNESPTHSHTPHTSCFASSSTLSPAKLPPPLRRSRQSSNAPSLSLLPAHLLSPQVPHHSTQGLLVSDTSTCLSLEPGRIFLSLARGLSYLRVLTYDFGVSECGLDVQA